METKTWYAVPRKRRMENQSLTVHPQRFSRRLWLCLAAALLLFSASALTIAETSNRIVPRFQDFLDPEGSFANLNLAGPTDTTTNPFFQDLGSNARRFATCHQPSHARSVTPPPSRHPFHPTDRTSPISR